MTYYRIVALTLISIKIHTATIRRDVNLDVTCNETRQTVVKSVVKSRDIGIWFGDRLFDVCVEKKKKKEKKRKKKYSAKSAKSSASKGGLLVVVLRRDLRWSSQWCSAVVAAAPLYVCLYRGARELFVTL